MLEALSIHEDRQRAWLSSDFSNKAHRHMRQYAEGRFGNKKAAVTQDKSHPKRGVYIVPRIAKLKVSGFHAFELDPRGGFP